MKKMLILFIFISTQAFADNPQEDKILGSKVPDYYNFDCKQLEKEQKRLTVQRHKAEGRLRHLDYLTGELGYAKTIRQCPEQQ